MAMTASVAEDRLDRWQWPMLAGPGVWLDRARSTGIAHRASRAFAIHTAGRRNYFRKRGMTVEDEVWLRSAGSRPVNQQTSKASLESQAQDSSLLSRAAISKQCKDGGLIIESSLIN